MRFQPPLHCTPRGTAGLCPCHVRRLRCQQPKLGTGRTMHQRGTIRLYVPPLQALYEKYNPNGTAFHGAVPNRGEIYLSIASIER